MLKISFIKNIMLGGKKDFFVVNVSPCGAGGNKEESLFACGSPSRLHKESSVLVYQFRIVWQLRREGQNAINCRTLYKNIYRVTFFTLQYIYCMSRFGDNKAFWFCGEKLKFNTIKVHKVECLHAHASILNMIKCICHIYSRLHHLELNNALYRA